MEQGLGFPKTKAISASKGGSHPKRSAAARWGNKHELFDRGFLVVPVTFLSRYATLKPAITPGEVLFILQLMSFKWEADAPYPSYATLASRMGVSEKMTRRYAPSLSKKKYLWRQFQHHKPNRFDLTGLFEALANAERGVREAPEEQLHETA